MKWLQAILNLKNVRHNRRLDLHQLERMLIESLAEVVEERSSELKADELTMLVAQSIHETSPETADVLWQSLKETAPRMLRERARLRSRFLKHNYGKWQEGFDLLRVLIVMTRELGESYVAERAASTRQDDDIRFEALVNLHARAIRVSEEVVGLMTQGFADGALSRWRTLHEIAVIMNVLAASSQEISERFILHRDVQSYNALRQYHRYQDRANLQPIGDTELESAKVVVDSIVAEHGREMLTDYGWAYPLVQVSRISLLDLEELSGLDHWRPRFRWASNDIHGAYAPYGTSLGSTDHDFAVTGHSDVGFTEPAQMMAISLNLANTAMFLRDPTLDLLVYAQVFQRAVGEISEVFLALDGLD